MPTSPPSSPSPPPRRSRASSSGRRTLVATVALVGILVAAIVSCGGDRSPTESASPEGQQVGAASSTVATTKALEPDQLDDPGVGPGECKIVTYTPPTATAPMGGELCRPKDDQRDVAIMVVHGGSGIGGSYEGMRRWANRYIAEGYVTFLPSYHLFDVGGESPVFPHPEQNIKAAVQYLRGTGNALGIDKDRIVVQGQSAGARVGAVAYTTPGDILFTGPELHPDIADTVNGFIGFYHPYDGTMQYADQYFGGTELSTDVKVQTRRDKGDALGHANDAVGPALFITGGEDWSIIVQQQDAFVAALTTNGHAAESVVIPDGGHGFDEGGPVLTQLGEQAAVLTLEWLNENFPQTPPRKAQVAPIDIDNLPTATGTPPTTYPSRPAPSGGYVGGTRSTTPPSRPSSGGNGSGGGAGVSTTVWTPPSVAPTSSAPPITDAPPTSSAPPTTQAPVTTVLPPTSVDPPPSSITPP